MGFTEYGAGAVEFNPRSTTFKWLLNSNCKKGAGLEALTREMLKVTVSSSPDKDESVNCLLALLGVSEALVPRYQFKELLKNVAPTNEGWIGVFYDNEEEEPIEVWVRIHTASVTLIRDRAVTVFKSYHRNNSLQLAVWYLNDVPVEIDNFKTKVYDKSMMASNQKTV